MSSASLSARQPAVSSAHRLQCELVRDFARLQELSCDWDRLWHNSRSEIFQKFAWARAYWKAWGADFSLCSLVVHEGSDVIGILPLASDGKNIRFLPESDYNDVLCEERRAPAVLATVMEALLKMQGSGTTCVLRNLSAESRIVRYLPSLPGQLQRSLALAYACPCPAIVAGHDAEIFAKAARKESLRRHENKLTRQGRLTFRHIESRQEIHQHLPVFFEQQISRRAVLGQHSHFQDPRERAFHAALIDELDPRSDMRFSVLELNRTPVACHFGFQANGKFIWYQSGFDVDLWNCSPGEVLVRKLLQYAHEAELQEFDFTIGGEMYKHRFANVVRKNFNLHLEPRPNNLAARSRRLQIVTRAGASQFRERLKTRPRLYKSLKKLWLGTGDFLRRQQRLLHRAGFTDFAWLVFRGILRTAVFEHREALVFSFSGESSQAIALVDSDARMEMRPGRFSELALLSLEYPNDFPWLKLHSFRNRIATGDSLCMARVNGEVSQFAWATTSSTVSIPEMDDGLQIPLDAPAMVVDGCWSAPGYGTASTCEFLQRLPELAKNSRELWTYQIAADRNVCKAMEAAGFRLRYRVVQIRLLHVLRRSWTLRPPDGSSAANSPADVNCGMRPV